ncbi:hypothetical protein FOA52_015745 [Chlamydomonas sp. UWO 241]|nr:hypothetical protein FOA52_015745 [Chlamydomonas sp. UWO 241]
MPTATLQRDAEGGWALPATLTPWRPSTAPAGSLAPLPSLGLTGDYSDGASKRSLRGRAGITFNKGMGRMGRMGTGTGTGTGRNSTGSASVRTTSTNGFADTSLREFILVSNTSTLRRNLKLLDFTPKSTPERDMPLSESITVDAMGQRRVAMGKFASLTLQSGRPISPPRPLSRGVEGGESLDPSSLGPTAAEEAVEYDWAPCILNPPMPNIGALIEVQGGFLHRLRSPAGKTRRGTGTGPVPDHPSNLKASSSTPGDTGTPCPHSQGRVIGFSDAAATAGRPHSIMTLLLSGGGNGGEGGGGGGGLEGGGGGGGAHWETLSLSQPSSPLRFQASQRGADAPAHMGAGPPSEQQQQQWRDAVLSVRGSPGGVCADAARMFAEGGAVTRPTTAMDQMGVATLLTPEEDLFHMANNLGIISADQMTARPSTVPSRGPHGRSGGGHSIMSSAARRRAAATAAAAAGSQTQLLTPRSPSISSGLQPTLLTRSTGGGGAGGGAHASPRVAAGLRRTPSGAPWRGSSSGVAPQQDMAPGASYSRSGSLSGAPVSSSPDHRVSNSSASPGPTATGSRMGVSTSEPSPRGGSQEFGGGGGGGGRSGASSARSSGTAGGGLAATLCQPPCPLGVSFKVLRRLEAELGDARLTTGEVVAQLILPETFFGRGRYTDVLEETKSEGGSAPLGPPHFFVAHSWGGNFSAMLETIAGMFSSRVPKINVDEAFFWIDICCVNQHEGRHWPDLGLMRDVLASCERTLLVIDRDGLALLCASAQWAMLMTSQLDKFDKGRLMVAPTHWDWMRTAPSFMLMDPSNGAAQGTWGMPNPSQRAEARLMQADMVKGRFDGVSLLQVTSDLRSVLSTGVKRELQRAEKAGSAAPRWLVSAANASALVFFLEREYGKAEECLKQASRAIEKASGKPVPELDVLATRLHMAFNMREKGSVMEAEQVLSEVLGRFHALVPHEMVIDAMLTQALILCELGTYMRGEMLVNRALGEVEKAHGRTHPMYARALLQLAHIAARQRLNQQTEEIAHEVLGLCAKRWPPLGKALRRIVEYEGTAMRAEQVGAKAFSHPRTGKLDDAVSLLKRQQQNSAGNGDVVTRDALGRGRSMSMQRGDSVSVAAIAAAINQMPTGRQPLGSVSPDVGGASFRDATAGQLQPLFHSGSETESREHEETLMDALSAMHCLAMCALSNNNKAVFAQALTSQVVAARDELLGEGHPATIESYYLQAKVLLRIEWAGEAEALLIAALQRMAATYGPDHPETLKAMGQLSDVHRELGHAAEAAAVEKAIVETGKTLLDKASSLMDRVRSMSVLCSILASRDHLIDKASLLLARVLVVYRERLGTDHKLTKLTIDQLMDLVDRAKNLGMRALQLGHDGDMSAYRTAEIMFKQTLTIQKLVMPGVTGELAGPAQNLADAQFGLGKIHEAQRTLQQAGLANGGTSTAYLRYANKKRPE